MNTTSRLDRVRTAIVAAVAATMLVAGGIALSAQADATDTPGAPFGHVAGSSPMKFQ